VNDNQGRAERDAYWRSNQKSKQIEILILALREIKAAEWTKDCHRNMWFIAANAIIESAQIARQVQYPITSDGRSVSAAELLKK